MTNLKRAHIVASFVSLIVVLSDAFAHDHGQKKFSSQTVVGLVETQQTADPPSSAAVPRFAEQVVVEPDRAESPPRSKDLEAEQQRVHDQMLLRELSIQKEKTEERQREVTGEPTWPSRRDRDPRMVRVFFATDRKPTGQSRLGQTFGSQASRILTFGMSDVRVPIEHRMGYLERPLHIARISLSEENESQHVMLKETQTNDDVPFYRELAAEIKQSGNRDAFVFVHGFNVTFDEAVRRTAQIAYDLAFDGAPILYSWPSHGARRHYAADEDAVQDTVPRLEAFLRRLIIEARAENVYLIAHSMGNRALTQAIERMYIRSNGRPGYKFRRIILTAPDVRSSTMQDVAPALVSMADQVTLYASNNDKALKLSRQINNYPRAGQAGDHILIMDGIYTVDVSAVDTEFLGHSYYASNRSVLADIFQAMRCAEHPDQRFSLQRRNQQGKTYWVFVP